MMLINKNIQLPLPFHQLTADIFAGAGGASIAMEEAFGRPVDIAINHNPVALSVHERNSPLTKHICSDIWEVDPLIATGGRMLYALWASPDCRHFSKAKGKKPVSPKVRALADVVLDWAAKVKPVIIFLENVEEFQTWGPLDSGNMPIKERKGEYFQHWVKALRDMGYAVEWRELRACDYGTPTSRKRLFIVARRDGRPIIWPEPTHGPGRLPYHTAAECIDFSLSCPSIFGRKKPLAENTMRRIAHGIKKFIIENQTPFIIPHNGSLSGASTLISVGYGEKKGQPPRVPGGRKHALVTAFLTKYFTGAAGSDLTDPMGTVTAIDHHALVCSFIKKMRGTNIGHTLDMPLQTISAGGTHFAETRAFLVKYFGSNKHGCGLNEPLHTISTKDRFGLAAVRIEGEPYIITDIGMRMLQPKELFAAQGFSPDFVFEYGKNGESITKTNQIKLCGNSVCRHPAVALIRANIRAETIQGR